MKYVLNDLEPKRVFAYFEEICNIPHGSYNIEKISNYLVEFAKEHHLPYLQDQLGNVIIRKEASAGYEKEPGIILQGHMDMVAVADPGSDIDLEKDGLKLKEEDGYVFAEHTSLGGDDGIALAYALAILSEESIKHPALECIFTVNEEVGMDGAAAIDVSSIQGRYFLNLDNEEEGHLLVSCAGGATYKAFASYETAIEEGCLLTIAVDGLKGGHSGGEAGKELANANILLVRSLLHLIAEDYPIHLRSLNGGEKENAISYSAKAELVVRNKSYILDALSEELAKLQEVYRMEYAGKDEGITLSMRILEESTKEYPVISDDDRDCILRMIFSLPSGVIGRSATMQDLVETSLNLGILRSSMTDDQKAGEVSLEYCVRSSIDSKKEELLLKMQMITEAFGASYEINGRYPGWKYQPNTAFEEIVKTEYKKLTGENMQVDAIHAGVECGFFVEKIPGIEAVSIGPDMKDIHTTREKLDIASVARTYELILAVLAHKG